MSNAFRDITAQCGLKIPQDVCLQGRGTTGMQYLKTKNYDPGLVIKFLKDQETSKIGKYIPNAWDCEDVSFLVASDVRFEFPGQPVGVALGVAKNGGSSLENHSHAVNVFWFEEDIGDVDSKREWNAIYFDATIGDVVSRFETHILIPIPISGFKDHKELIPLENLKFLDKAAFALDRAYDFELIEEVENSLVEWKHNDPQKKHKVEPVFYTYNDRVFYWFAHIRQLHKGAPVGVVFGKV